MPLGGLDRQAGTDIDKALMQEMDAVFEAKEATLIAAFQVDMVVGTHHILVARMNGRWAAWLESLAGVWVFPLLISVLLKWSFLSHSRFSRSSIRPVTRLAANC